MDVDWNPMGEKMVSIHPCIHHIHSHPPHPSIHPSTTSIHIHPSIHCFSLWPTFWSCKIRDEKKEHKKICSDTKSWQHFRAKEKKQQQQQKKKGLGEQMEKLKLIEKTHHHHHSLLLLLLLHYHLLHVETIGCRLNILLQKTEEVCSKLWFARKVESLSFVGCVFLKYKTLPNFGVLFCFLVVCTIGTQEEELW